LVVAFLRRHRKQQATSQMASHDVWNEYDVVFDDSVGQPPSPWMVSADFRRFIAELGLPRPRFHDLRHAQADLRVGRGRPGRAGRLGHLNVEGVTALLMKPGLLSVCVGVTGRS